MQHRQVRWLGAFKDARRIDSDLAKSVDDVGSVAHQSAGFGIDTCRIGGRKSMTRRQYGQLDTRSIEERAWANEQSVRLLAHHSSERRVDFPAGGNLANKDLLLASVHLYVAA